MRDLEQFESIKAQLDDMKVFGEKLKLNELRMATIKDKIEIFASQVDAFREQAEPESTETAVTTG